MLANPALLRAMIVLVCATGAFVVGLVFTRLLRQQIAEEGALGENSRQTPDSLPMHVYNTVIQQLKQQKQELATQLQAEQERARASDTLNQAVWLNISSGVLIFGPNGLVKTFNPAAKSILGFASMNGMSAEDIFRGSLVRRPKQNLESNEPVALAEEVDAVLRQASLRRDLKAEYESPAGDNHELALSILPVRATGDGKLLGIACLIDNLSRQGSQLHKNINREAPVAKQAMSAASEAPAAEVAAGQ